MAAIAPRLRTAALAAGLLAALPAAAQYRPQPPVYAPSRPYRPPAAYPAPAAPAPAWERREPYALPGVEWALRAGVSVPGGYASGGIPMRNVFGDQVLLGLDVGLRASPNLYVGLLLEGGFGGAGDASATWGCGGSCGSSAVGRFGVALHYHFQPGAPLDPWVGYGLAFTGASASGDTAAGHYDLGYSGIEFAKLMAGVDLALAGTTAIGLQAELTTGVYSSARDSGDGVLAPAGAPLDSTVHSWFTIGPRVRF